MRNLFIAVAGFLIGGGLMAALAFAVPQPTSGSVPAAAPAVAANLAGRPAMGMAKMRVTAMAASSPAAAAATRSLTIQHVMRGCHVWSNGMTSASMMRFTLKPNGRLMILNHDVDVHQLMELAGPAQLRVGGPMLMNHGTVVSFPMKGVYTLRTRTVEMPTGTGMNGTGMQAKTIGPDNTLRLVIRVV